MVDRISIGDRVTYIDQGTIHGGVVSDRIGRSVVVRSDQPLQLNGWAGAFRWHVAGFKFFMVPAAEVLRA